ncbi:hypothetical protein BGZ65_005637 [Modicella reniformis]|uniref:Uncharacterized protein n=1 Tax=Modicella reniformis TaxID=1440133 RepID=A0A9P6LYQ4_9FUNG|nr:hypothetical protein BGZ65_005637 [Modicella reniformis]
MTMALIPYYNLTASDVSVYTQLTRGSLAYGGEEGFRRASVTMNEYLLIDGERDKRLSRKTAIELTYVAEQLRDVYKTRGNGEKAQELERYIASWKSSL